MSKDRKKEKFSSNSKNHSLFDNNYFIGIVLFVFSILLYQNTFNNGYALDDHTVISANKFTKQGISAITTIFTHAYWFGYDGSNNAVYRPFSLIIFAIEYDLFGKSAKISHIINVTLYGLTGILLFLTLLKLFKNNASIPKVNVRTISLVVSLLFLAHPIHTEVVANIKSRDEILSLLFVLFSIYLIFSYLKSNAIKHLLGGLICFLIALLSKETIFSFIAIIPILLYCFTNEHKHSIIKLSSGYLIVGAIYLLLRISFLNKSFSGDFANDVMTNSLLATNGYLDRLASCFFILLKYIALFLYPKDLTYDYSFNQIPNLEFFDLKSIASILIIIGLLLFAIKKLPSKNIFSFSILYFFISISIVSNIVIIIGAPMAERFAYVPSLGFCIALGYFLVLISDKIKFLTNHPQVKVFSLLAILLLAYSFKTVSRNNAWKNNLTLFETDIETSNNSSRAHLFLGIELLKRTKEAQRAINEMSKAVAINPKYRDAHYNLGVAFEKLNKLDSAKMCYLNTVELDSMHVRSFNNIGMIYGKYENFDKAIENLQIAIKKVPKYGNAYTNLGSVYGKAGQFDNAIGMLNRSLKLKPRNFRAYDNLGIVYAQKREYEKAIDNFKKALALNPKLSNAHFNLGITYQTIGDQKKAKKHFEKAYQLNPKLKR